MSTFLSYHHHTDGPAAGLLAAALQPAGIAVFQDVRDLRSGVRWLARLQQAISECSAFVVLVGRDGSARWVAGEVEAALNRHFGPHDDAQRLPLHPLLLPGATADSLPPFLALFQAEPWVLRQVTQRLDRRYAAMQHGEISFADFAAPLRGASGQRFGGPASRALAAGSSMGVPRQTRKPTP